MWHNTTGRLDGHPSLIFIKLTLLEPELGFAPMASNNTSIGGLPLGVAILSVLIGIFGFFVIVLGVLILFGTAAALAGFGVTSAFGMTGTIGGLIVLVIGVIILAVAVGLWNQELWALVLAILVLIFYGVVNYLASSWLALIIVVLLLIYLIAVARHFD
jgi:hypothetical protein